MGIVWDRTSAFVGERFGALATVALAAFVVPGVVSTWLQVLSGTAGYGARVVLGAIVLLLSLPSVWGSLTIIALATGEGSVGTAGGLAVRRLPATVIVSIVLGLAAALLAVPVPLLLAARGYDIAAMAAGQAGAMTVDAQTSSMVALYVLVLTPVLLIALTRLILINAVVLREGALFGAIRRSWTLTRRHGWRIFGMLLLFALVGGIARLAARTVFGSVFTLLFGGGGGLTTAFLLTAIVTTCIQAVVMLLLAAFEGKLYVALTTSDSVWPA
ncbi:hypothetical protein A7X12_09295 [Sphingomonas sp. TDK1]|nr:hypothetical protein A7X12_09295 [Sphingomonas sp. TDK1]